MKFAEVRVYVLAPIDFFADSLKEIAVVSLMSAEFGDRMVCQIAVTQHQESWFRMLQILEGWVKVGDEGFLPKA